MKQPWSPKEYVTGRSTPGVAAGRWYFPSSKGRPRELREAVPVQPVRTSRGPVLSHSSTRWDCARQHRRAGPGHQAPADVRGPRERVPLAVDRQLPRVGLKVAEGGGRLAASPLEGAAPTSPGRRGARPGARGLLFSWQRGLGWGPCLVCAFLFPRWATGIIQLRVASRRAVERRPSSCSCSTAARSPARPVAPRAGDGAAARATARDRPAPGGTRWGGPGEGFDDVGTGSQHRARPRAGRTSTPSAGRAGAGSV